MDFSRRGGLFSIKPKSRFLQARLERKGQVLEREGDSGQGADGGGEGGRGKVLTTMRYVVRFRDSPGIPLSGSVGWLVGERESSWKGRPEPPVLIGCYPSYMPAGDSWGTFLGKDQNTPLDPLMTQRHPGFVSLACLLGT